jgi:hypothetical protein
MANLKAAMGDSDTEQMEYLTEKLETAVMHCVRAASAATA